MMAVEVFVDKAYYAIFIESVLRCKTERYWVCLTFNSAFRMTSSVKSGPSPYTVVFV